jgi:hypothetical protein
MNEEITLGESTAGFCRYCGAERAPLGAQFCWRCGGSLAASQPTPADPQRSVVCEVRLRYLFQSDHSIFVYLLEAVALLPEGPSVVKQLEFGSRKFMQWVSMSNEFYGAVDSLTTTLCHDGWEPLGPDHAGLPRFRRLLR